MGQYEKERTRKALPEIVLVPNLHGKLLDLLNAVASRRGMLLREWALEALRKQAESDGSAALKN